MLFSEYRSWLPGCVAGLVGFAGLTLPVLAQEAAEASAGDAVALEEIVVTARKRAETLLEVPVAVTALTADDIDQKGIENLNDVALFTPGLTYFDSIQNQLGTPVIRGISQTNLNSPDRNVAIFYGGVYLSSTSGANLEILDVDRVEVVKGPQSALYGRNAFNGAINFVPAAPTETFFSKVEATVGSDERYEGKLVVSGPLTDRIRGRFAASYNTFDGTYRNAAEPNDNLGGYETKNASGSLDFEVTDDLEVKLFGFYTDDHRDPGHLWVYDNNNCGPNPMAPTATCGEIQYRSNLASSPIAEGVDREVTLGALDISYQLGSLTFISQTAQYDATIEAFTEYTANGIGDLQQIIRQSDVNALVAMGVPLTTAWLSAPVVRTQRVLQYTGNPPADFKSFSQEFRIESDQEKRLRGSVGLFYYKNEAEAITASSFDGTGLSADERVRDQLLFTLSSPAIVRTDPRDMFVSTFLDRTDYQRAYFGTFEFDAFDNLTIGAEARHDTEDRQQTNLTVGPSSLQRKEFDYNTWRGHVDYEISPVQKVYVSAAKGVDRLTGRGIVANGVEYEVDCVIFASGFEISTEISRRYAIDAIEGRDGVSLFDHWHESYRTLHGMTSRGFPNQFHTGFIQGGVSANTTAMYEQQAQHIAYIIAEAQKRGAITVEPSQQGQDGWVNTVRGLAMDNSAFEMSCTPGYYNNEGRGGRDGNASFLGDFYSPGFYAFDELLADWRARGDLDGLELRS